MTRYIQRHSLQARLTHGISVISCLWLIVSGLFVFVPALASAVGGNVVFLMRMSHRVFGAIFILIPLISAIKAPQGVKRIVGNLTAKWDKDDWEFLRKFPLYMFAPKKVHMPEQHELKSGQRIADTLIWVPSIFIAISGVILWFGTSLWHFPAQVLVVSRIVHDIAFFFIAFMSIAHIYLGAGIFQPYRGTGNLMFGDGKVNESDALYHWGYWAREELEDGSNVSEK